MNNIYKVWYYAFSNFFLLLLVNQLFEYINIDLYLHQILMLLCVLTGFICAFKNAHFKTVDMVMFIYVGYIIINALFSSYINQTELVRRAMIIQTFPIFCYFIGRNTNFDIKQIILTTKYPLLFSCLAGLYFYFSEPAWYYAMKSAAITEYTSDTQLMEIFRLSSFWPHPYQIGYGTILFYFVWLYEMVVSKGLKWNIINLSILFILVTVLLLAQLRVCILFAIIASIMCYVVKGITFKNIFKISILAILIAVLSFLLVSKLDNTTSEYISTHISSLFEEDAIQERIQHTSGEIEYSLFGDGFGRYDYAARKYNMSSLIDNEYANQISELGYIGFSLLLFILLITILAGLKIYRKKLVEYIIILFFVVSMAGASVLSNHHQYNFIFWFALGSFWRYYYNPSNS